jgi:hypothetical protein
MVARGEACISRPNAGKTGFPAEQEFDPSFRAIPVVQGRFEELKRRVPTTDSAR